MRGPLSITLGIGIGWVLGVTLMMAVLYLGGNLTDYGFGTVLGNMFVLSFPGLMFFIVSVILALKDNTGGNL